MTIQILTGDALAVLRGMEAGRFHCCVTSPPYFSLRDYGVAGQIGLEATFEEWLEKLVAVFEEVRRVLRDDGTLWLNCGDSYAGSGPISQEQTDRDIRHATVGNALLKVQRRIGTVHGLKPKDLIGQPWRLAFALRDAGWYLRSEIIWHKPNPMPESVEDRCTKSHEQIFMLSKAPKYFFDMDAIREPHISDGRGGFSDKSTCKWAQGTMANGTPLTSMVDAEVNPAGRNKRTVWTVPSHAFSEAHFATFPPDLIIPCVKAGTSERGCCPECGAAWRRETERIGGPPRGDHRKREDFDDDCKTAHATGTVAGSALSKIYAKYGYPETKTLGFRPTCEHGREPVPCRVLDCFGGAGTTALVADRLGRDCTLIELNAQYVKLAEKRLRADCPMFAKVEVTP